MIKPTVGRHVNYWPGDNTGIWQVRAEDPCAAVIAGVIDDRTVNLVVFDGDGVQHQRSNVKLIHPEDTQPAPGSSYCSWMEFQKGQAKKTDLDLHNMFTYHPPKPHQPELYEAVRCYGLGMANLIVDRCPDCRERVKAIEAIEEAVFWANAAIARHGV